jgi:hypothetical protein
MKQSQSLVLFHQNTVRRYWDESKELWYFSVVDVVSILSESADGRNYWKVLKYRLKEEGSEVVTKCNQLKMQASDGKFYLTDAADTETMFRIIQSIPSPKAEPFKLWLARVGYERIEETEDPEIAVQKNTGAEKVKREIAENQSIRSRNGAFRSFFGGCFLIPRHMRGFLE